MPVHRKLSSRGFWRGAPIRVVPRPERDVRLRPRRLCGPARAEPVPLERGLRRVLGGHHL
ncbi:hypothetical protein ACFFX0_14340 [Citricoccus parietis]|uniref:Uncharacterized protein n=1 Tax=Citricoccus parietis TaxID=592307 RepID=A0ABV5G055_9MICC